MAYTGRAGIAYIWPTVENAIKFDVSPPLASIRPPARPQGAFLREHIVKKIPLPPVKLAALADTVLQSKGDSEAADWRHQADRRHRARHLQHHERSSRYQRIGRQRFITCNG